MCSLAADGAAPGASAAEEEVEMVCLSCNAPVMANPIQASMMESMMRRMMNGMMKIKGIDTDPTVAEVSNFMVPAMFDPAGDADKWALFQQQRPYCVPGYEPQAPQPGEAVPDGPLFPLVDGPETTLLTEARALAAKHGTSKVVLSFDGHGHVPVLARVRRQRPVQGGGQHPDPARVHPRGATQGRV